MNCTVLTRYALFFMCLRLWFECCDFWLDFSVVWMVSVPDYGWVVSSWHRFNFLGTMFFCFLLVSATSSYADDIACIEICMSRNLWVVSTAERTVCSFSIPFSMVLLTTGCS
jgi:hypothetical protein